MDIIDVVEGTMAASNAVSTASQKLQQCIWKDEEKSITACQRCRCQRENIFEDWKQGLRAKVARPTPHRLDLPIVAASSLATEEYSSSGP